ncbi:MAG: S-layer homology domain-containing protein [Chloroflexota bacterium]|nr:S-layer homology domain-containing protein [Chloroflexota bacterium]
MTILNSVTVRHRKSIAVLLSGILAVVLVGFTGPVVAGPTAPSSASAPEATCPGDGQCFADVPPGSPFYDYANNLYKQDIVSGYACGGPGEPCDAQNRPYYRPGSSVTRAQMTKFVDLARTQPGIRIDTATHAQPLYSRSTAANGVGVTGVSSTGSLSSGVLGAHEGSGPGVRGTSATGFGGEFTSDNYRGAYVRGGPSWIALYADGWTYVNGNLDVTANAWVTGDLSVSGNCTGCTQAYGARNTGDESIRLGDLVAAAGVEVDPKSGQPVLLVRRAGQPGDAIIGVAGSALVRDTAGERAKEQNQPLVPADGAAAPNAYVRVIVSGLAQVRVTTQEVGIGDLLAPSAAGGATRALSQGGFARAVSTPDAQGLVWALVSAGH